MLIWVTTKRLENYVKNWGTMLNCDPAPGIAVTDWDGQNDLNCETYEGCDKPVT